MIRLFCLLTVTFGASGMEGLANEDQQARSLQLTLPSVCYAVVGVPMSIYYDNIVLTDKPEHYRFQIESNLGAAEARRWTVTPAAIWNAISPRPVVDIAPIM
jgi:hypothetical protein